MSIISCLLRMSKSSRMPGASPCSRRRTVVISAIALFATVWSLIFTVRESTVRVRIGCGALV